MKKKRLLSLSITLLLLWLFLLSPAWSQLVLGQYEDEAPLRSWNQYGFLGATSLAVGGTRFAFATDCSTSLANPSLLPLLSCNEYVKIFQLPINLL